MYHCPISVWDGTTYTDIVYDDDDYDGRIDYDYAYGDPFNMNDPSVRAQFEQSLHTKHTQAKPQAPPQATPYANQAVPQQDPPPSKHTTTKQHEDSSPAYTYDTLQLLFLTTHYENTNEYIDKFPLYII